VAEARAVVVGGGLAGVTAALRLADGGRAVTLVERRPRLGGAAFSFKRGELTIDNGQHVFLRCCEAYQWFVQRVAARDQVFLQDHLSIPVLRPDGRSATLSRIPGVPAPAHLGASLARYSVLSPADRARAIRGALALKRLDPADRALDRQTLGAYLRRHGQNDATIDALWGIVATATLNLLPDDANLALAAKVFRTGLLDRADASDVGHALVPLGDIHGTAARRALESAGVEVLLGHRVTKVEPGAVVHLEGPTGDRVIDTDAVVVAVPHAEAFVTAPALTTSPAAPAARLRNAPILNVHVVYDRQVTDLSFAAGVDSPVQWFFDRTVSSGLRALNPTAQYLAVTVSAADGLIDEPAQTITDRFVAELARLLPRARGAGVTDAFVTRERQATFRQEAGANTLRPAAETGLDGIWLAGAWTDTGWPDTMESAVRSGINAAEAALRIPARDRMGFAA